MKRSTYIHEREDWPHFTWDNETILPILASVRHLQGRLPGRMERLGFDLIERATLESLILDVVDVLLDATRNYDLQLSEERLLGWHNALFQTGYSGHLKIDVGRYRSAGMKVVS